jgi:N-acetylmuramoyl-L-alanine amidase
MVIGKSRDLIRSAARARAALRAGMAALAFVVVTGLMAAFSAAAQPAQRQGEVISPPSVPIVAVDARLESTEDKARFSATLSARVAVSFESLSQPRRIIAELPEVSFQASLGAARQGGLVRGFRAGLVAPGRSRIVFDLSGPARMAALRQTVRADGVIELAIEFEAQSAAQFEAQVAEGATKRAAAALAPLVIAPRTAPDRLPLVVIDPGHGGIDPGAVAGNVMEKSLVLAIALKLKERVEAGGVARVMMTRADDRFLSLSERVRVAREARADLFVSLHADSLSAAQDVRGATVYTGSERATDVESARLAQKENAADAIGGAETGERGEEVNDILMDLARRETRAQSGAVAARLVTEMSGAVRMHRVPQRAAGFRVLTAPDVPSVLIELGFLSSRNDVALLTSEAWQQQAADAIAKAVIGHFAGKISQPRRGASISP